MQELIQRLSTLLDGIGREEQVRPGTVEASMLTSRDWTRLRGMRDVLLAMEDRTESLRSEQAREANALRAALAEALEGCARRRSRTTRT